MERVSGGCETPSAPAARRKLRISATATKRRSSSKSRGKLGAIGRLWVGKAQCAFVAEGSATCGHVHRPWKPSQSPRNARSLQARREQVRIYGWQGTVAVFPPGHHKLLVNSSTCAV